ncbi:MAG: 1-(5-phosphoribosyl)-5-[(5-phosphoribosylamino)methylideneamino]imidazole-4-carboxamide isomerase [Chitinophagales bacterium]|nr:1-(5-phosphoribosyl)-5-[(5-phosphoribosylamino)methylideneamino]imidazole-4-carboxamide isomerase [Chitinophagales bacterium]
MVIVPAIDIINSQCVRLTKGDYNTTKIYNSDPLQMALKFEEAGITHLHLVDLDGAKNKAVVNWEVLEKIAKNTSLKIDFSGGLSSEEQLEKAFDLGAYKLTIGSMAVKAPEIVKSWIAKFKADKLILGADVLGHHIAIHGWKDQSDMEIYDFIEQYVQLGIYHIMCTDVSKDGMLQGPSLELYKDILKRFPEIQLVASGGVSTIQDLRDLKTIGCAYTIVGKAIYEGKININELKSNE